MEFLSEATFHWQMAERVVWGTRCVLYGPDVTNTVCSLILPTSTYGMPEFGPMPVAADRQMNVGRCMLHRLLEVHVVWCEPTRHASIRLLVCTK